MTAHALTEAETDTHRPEVWDTRRLSELLDDVGDTGIRNLLRLFEADMAFLLGQLSKAIDTGNIPAARRVLSTVRDAAENLGLGALAAQARLLGSRPPDQSFPDLLAREIARVRFVPPIKRVS